MTNCLVTKLKSVVDDNLPKIGALRLTIAHNDIPIQLWGTGKVKNLSENFVSPSGVNEVSLNPNNSTSVTAKNTNVIELTDKYELLVFKYGGIITKPISIKELDYMPKIQQLQGIQFVGDLSVLNRTNNDLITLALQIDDYGDQISKVTGNLSKITTLYPNLTMLVINNPISGDLALLSNYLNLNTVTLFNTNVQGTIEDLVAAFRAKGKTVNAEGITLRGFDTSEGITYEGATLPQGDKWHRLKLTWDASTITVVSA